MSNQDNEFTEPVDLRITTTPDQVVRFLDLLTDDDEFRRRFEEDTIGVLAEYGVEIDSENVPSGVTAPPKEALQAVREQLWAAHDPDLPTFSFLGWGMIFFSFMGLRSFISFGSFKGLPREDPPPS